jgi:acetyl-CoA C-acetyltransferase
MRSQHAVKRAGIDPAEVEDVILGAAALEGTTGGNVARLAALRAGLPVTTGGVSINRFCSSGLQASRWRRTASSSKVAPAIVAGGVESISCVQNEANKPHAGGPVR